MEYLSVTATDEEIRQVIRQWIAYLAEEQYEAAVAMIAPETLPYNGSFNAEDYPTWTSSLLAAVISNYGLAKPWEGQDRTWKVVPIEEHFRADFETYFTVDREPFEQLEMQFCGGIHVDLPLDLDEGNGLSDLTARFWFREVEQGKMVLVLEDIHVM